MLVLSATTDNVKVALDGAPATNQARCVASWRDITASAYTPGRTVVLTNSATPVNAVPAPAASTQRVVDFLQIRNNDTATRVVTVTFDDNGTSYTLWSGSLLTLETIQYENGAGWRKLAASGAQSFDYPATPTDVQAFTTPGADTWTKPTTFTPKFVHVICYGAGGGGGAGGSADDLDVKMGGAGGGGGAMMERTFLASELAATEDVVVGASGTAGVPGASGALGGDGGIGGTSSFGSGTPKKVAAYGGGGGRGGAVTAAAGGGGGGGGTASAGGTGGTAVGVGGAPGVGATTGMVGGTGSNGPNATSTTHNAEYGGGGGGGHTSTPVNIAGGSSLHGGAGGGCGAGTTTTPTLVAGTDGGLCPAYVSGGGGAAGTSTPPVAGTDGADGGSTYAGAGGGGGGTSVGADADGAAGGDGGSPAGGGGGGGAGCTGGANVGGAGGLGGAGAVYVFTW